MIDSIIQILNENDFITHQISFNDITANPTLSVLKELKVDNDSIKLLKSFPHLFVVHKTLPPERGIFFMLVQNNQKIDSENNKIYRKYFPQKIGVVYKINNEYFANWYNEKDSIPFIKFLKKAIK